MVVHDNAIQSVAPAAGVPVVGRSRRATRAIINLDRFAANVRWFRQRLATGCDLMAVVKANAYGHGAVMIARTALAAGASQLAVATVDEGTQLRAAGIKAPTLVLGPTFTDEIDDAVRLDLALTVADPDFVAALAATARSTSAKPVAVHVKVDTGMRRFGAPPDIAVEIARDVTARPELSLDGFFTHFATADEEDEGFTDEQASLLRSCVDRLAAMGIRPGRVHAANSAGTVRFERYHFHLVRVGIAMYGLRPSPEVLLPDAVRPVMCLCSRVARVIDLAPGDTVSYGRMYRAEGRERAALVPIGYADGYPRSLSNRARMSLGGQRVSVRGRVCMDQTVVHVPAGVRVRVGDEVLIAGDENGFAPSFDELAELAGTISYEMVTSISARVPRFYTENGNTTAVCDLLGLGPN